MVEESVAIAGPAAMLLLILLVAGAWTIQLFERHVARTTGLTWIGLAVSLTVGLVLVLVQGPFGSRTDEFVYHLQSMRVAEYLSGDLPLEAVNLDSGKQGWPWLLGLMYFVAGPSPLLGILASCLFMTLALVATGGTTRLLGDPRRRILIAGFTGCPTVLILGPSLLRESASWAAVALSVLGAALLHKGDRGQGVALLFFGIAFAGFIRAPLAGLLGLGLVLGLALSRFRRSHSATATLLACCIVGAIGVASMDFLLDIAGLSEESVLLNRDYLSDIATTGFNVPGSAGAAGLDLSVLMASLPRVLLGPFPQEVGLSGVWIWVLVNAAYWWALLFLAVKRIVKDRLSGGALLVAVAAGVVMLGLGIALTNYGIVVRLRAIAALILLPLIAAAPTAGEKRGVAKSAYRIVDQRRQNA